MVPPAPEKHAIGTYMFYSKVLSCIYTYTNAGRFEEDFVENRRVLLERMLKKVAAHPILHRDVAFRVFLESENFSVDVRTAYVVVVLSVVLLF